MGGSAQENDPLTFDGFGVLLVKIACFQIEIKESPELPFSLHTFLPLVAEAHGQ